MTDLKGSKQWVNYILFIDPDDPTGKPQKIPKNPNNGYGAKVNEPKTWGTYELALSKIGTTITHRNYFKDKPKIVTDKIFKDNKGREYTEHQCEIAGIGFCFTDNIVGIDIDDCMDGGKLEKQADEIVKHFNSYTELSPSQKGYHILIRCDLSKLPANYKEIYDMNPQRHNMECYVAGITKKYFTYTGATINDFDIEDRTQELLEFLEKYMKRPTQNANSTRDNAQKDYNNNPQDVIIIIEKSKNYNTFAKLFYKGDKSDYNDNWSRADLGLCNILAFYCRGDYFLIDTIFRQSALMRAKWDEMHGATTYGAMTINKAIDSKNGNFYKPAGRPKKEKNQENKNAINPQDKKITIAGVKKYLELLDLTVKYNETTRKTEIHGFNDYNENYIVDSFPIIIYDQLNLMYEKCPKSDVQDFLKVIMMNNAYNPVLELIEGGTWDGVDRLPELFRIMNVANDDRLSKTLIYKWLWQNLSMLRNYRGDFGADGLLVLKGGQATGKTTFARKMALKNNWFGEGLLLDVRDKDTVIRAVSCWIGELGEIESTFKSDINALKAFINNSTDKYRVPYGRTAEDLPRRTSFIGTCNSDEYLIDETGNRRYWTVPIDELMDLNALKEFDALQLYLQVNEQAKNNIQGFRLTPNEQKALAERNSRHEKPLKAETEIKDILFSAERDNLLFEEMTVTEFKELYSVLKIYSANQIGIALRKAGIEPDIKKKDGKTQKLLNLPRPKDKYRINISDF